jgi:tetratricopeptide (TPR) repeat protein
VRPRAANAFAILALLMCAAPARGGLIEQAAQLVRSAERTRDRDRRFAIADQAKTLCEQAARERPRDPVPHIMLARALTVPDPQRPESCRPHTCERAVAELKEARRLDGSGVEANHIAGELGLVFSRIGAHEEALAEYDRALRLVDTDRRPGEFFDFDRSRLYSNSAETLMALGRLREAIERYREAEATAIAGTEVWEMAEWGLGVALDRDEQIDKARHAIQRALDVDPTMSRLVDEGVFFEPPGDKRYYEAFGHEVAGDRELALAAWRAFVVEAPASPYLKRARAHLAELKRTPTLASAVDPSRLHLGLGEIMDLRGVRPTAALREVVQLHEDELKLCYARTLRSDPSARGEMRLQVLIDPSGQVFPGPRVLLSTVTSDSLGHCVELAASTWRFPSIDVAEPEEIIVTLMFGGR